MYLLETIWPQPQVLFLILVYLCNLLFKIKFDHKDFFGSGEGNEKSKNNSNDWWQLEYLTRAKLDSLIKVVNNLNDVFGNQKYFFKLKYVELFFIINYFVY